jgi:hypothetical protein
MRTEMRDPDWVDVRNDKGYLACCVKPADVDGVILALKEWKKAQRGNPVGWVVKVSLDAGSADAREEYVRETNYSTTTPHFSEAIRFRTMEDAQAEVYDWASYNRATIHPVYRAKKK